MVARTEENYSDGDRIGGAARLLGASGYERSRIQRYIARVHDGMFDSVARWVDSPGRILDVGCGTGRLLNKLGERWPTSELTGIDPSQAMISVAKQQCSSASFHIAEAESIPIQSASIDLAVTSISLHHWRDPTQGLRELGRVLSPGGCLCIGDITMPHWLARLVRSGAMSPSALSSVIAEAGLEPRELRVILARFIVVAVATKPDGNGRADPLRRSG